MRRATRMIAVLATMVATFVACFSKPGDPNFHAPNDGGTDTMLIDAKVFMDAPKVFMDAPDAKVFMDAAAGGCGTVHDDFNTHLAMPCGAWGTFSGGGGGTFTGDHNTNLLTLTASTPPGTFAKCTSMGFNLERGTSVQIVQPATVGPSVTTFALTLFNPNTTFTFTITGAMPNYNLHLQCPPPSTAVDSMNVSAPPWVRFVTSNTAANHQPGTVTVKVQFSLDGSAATPIWSDFNNCVVSGQADGSGFVELGATSGSSATTTAKFDNFNEYPCVAP